MTKESRSYREGKYHREQYTIHFLYNKDDEFAQVNIKGRYIDVAEIARVFYERGVENYTPEILEIAPEVTLRGNLSELLNEVSKLI